MCGIVGYIGAQQAQDIYWTDFPDWSTAAMTARALRSWTAASFG